MIEQAKAKKSLGQHFLKDPNTAKRIADLGKISSTSQVIEIGPGPGALTKHLYKTEPQKLLLLEKDSHYAQAHRQENIANSKIEVQECDALQFAWSSLVGDWIIMGNLPYNIASPLMWDIVSQTENLERAVFLIQKEVADRIVAPAGSKQYGALSVWIQSFVEARRHFILPPSAFSPPPKVDSAVVVFSPKANKAPHPEALAQVIKMCFNQRRKQLQTILKNNQIPRVKEILAELDIAEEIRPEMLDLHSFWRLAAKIHGLPL